MLDSKSMYSDSQAITGSAASTNALNHGVARNLGVGVPLHLVAVVTEAFTDGSSNSTVTAKCQTDSVVGFGSASDRFTFDVFAALSAVGTRRIRTLVDGDIDNIYSRMYYTVANGDLTTGKISAFLTQDYEAYKSYAQAYTVR